MLKIAWNDYYSHNLPEGHRFPMEKYNLLPQQLLYEGSISDDNIFKPDRACYDDIADVHDKEYIQKLHNLKLTRKEERATGFPLSSKLVEREYFITGGTMQCVDFALEYGVAGNIAGGTHHAYRDRGEGFCLFNDIAVSSIYALKKKTINQILVVDLDVHQGNGTAKIFEGDPRVFTFSMHGAKNYPLHKEKSDLDIGLEDGTDDETYLHILRENMEDLLPRVKPDLIFFQSGVDILSTDKLGRLSVSIPGCKERDRLVFENAEKNNIPVVFNMGGGYSEKIAAIVEAHANTYRQAIDIFF